MKVTSKSDGVTAYLRASRGISNTTDVEVDWSLTDGQPTIDTVYSVDQGDKIILTLIPSEDSTDTAFAFTYWTEGTEYSWYMQMYHDLFVSNPDGELLMYIVGGCLAVCLLTVCCCCGYCLKQKLCPSRKVEAVVHEKLAENS